jgi:hypothetical protein
VGAAAHSYGVSFSLATSVGVLGSAHGLGTTDIVVSCWTGDVPRTIMEPDGWTVDPATYDVVIYFPEGFAGRCVLR